MRLAWRSCNRMLADGRRDPSVARLQSRDGLELGAISPSIRQAHQRPLPRTTRSRRAFAARATLTGWRCAKPRANRWSLNCAFGSKRRQGNRPPGGPITQAFRYALNHWDGLERFLEDGRIELDNNSVERAMRPVCLSRKNVGGAMS